LISLVNKRLLSKLLAPLRSSKELELLLLPVSIPAATSSRHTLLKLAQLEKNV